MSFNKIIGQELPKKIIRQSLNNNRYSHAYIIEGVTGSGKFIFAQTFAKALLCETMKDDCCNICSSCRRIENGNHPDVHLIKPEGNSIKDGQIEEIQKYMNRKPFEADLNVFIISKAESMTPKAQNRFLKKLEEPTGKSVIIFLAENENSLLPTIVSRCTQIKLTALPENVIVKYMMNKYGIDEQEASSIATFSYGIIGRAEQLYKSEEFKNIKTVSGQIFNAFLENESDSLIEILDIFEANKDVIGDILEMLIFQFRDMAVLNATDNNKMIINNDNIKTIQKHSDIIGYMKSINIIKKIEIAKKDLSGNINFNLVIKNLLLRMQEERNGKCSRCTI